MIHINAQNLGAEIIDILAYLKRVGWVGVSIVAGRNVEVGVGAEFQASPIVAASGPGNQNLLGFGVNGGRVGVTYRKA